AITMDTLSNGRFIMGLGTSGPQVVEGWHGVPFNKTLTWLREYVTIVKMIFAREDRLEFDGVRYQIPYRGEGSTGQGKPLRSMVRGRPDIPVYTGSMAPKSQMMAAELADGCLLTCMHPDRSEVLMENFNPGFEKAGNGKGVDNFDIAPTVVVIIGDPQYAMMPCKMQLALYIGGMGSKTSRRLARRFRPCSSTASAMKPSLRCQTRWSTRCTSSARKTASAIDSNAGRNRRSAP
ncbi:MAG: LLM class flavin-dependent oxidoreductase, partial [Deltaproteobacteria bacterium]|nr:LLM class flavin-dependent oxidoreductase [Deltaproteobacteria bacterium]